MAPTSGIRRLGLIIAVFALTASGFVSQPASAAPLGQGENITWLPGTVELDPLLADAIMVALNDARALLGESSYFAATDLRADAGWALTSIVGLTTLAEDQSWHAEDGSWFGTVLAHETQPGIWEAGIEGAELYRSMLSQVPAAVLESADPPHGDFAPRALSSAIMFPWAAGKSMIYGPLGIHNGGSGWKAVDMASDGNTAAGHASGKIVAAQAGRIDYICKDGTSVTIRSGSLLYAHLLDNPGLYSGRTFAQGEELGQLRAGSFNALCGYATQPANWFHLHWAFPNADLAVENWTLSMATGIWTNGAKTAAPGRDWILARPGTAQDCSQIAGNGVFLFANANCNAAASGASSSFAASTPRTDLTTGVENAVSSLYVGPGWSVRLFQDATSGAGSTWRCFSQTAPNLAGTLYEHGATQNSVEDSASSVRIYDRPGCPGASSDFDDDSRSDAVKFYPNDGSVSWLGSGNGAWRTSTLGSGTYSYVPRSDFDGDAITDLAKYVPSAGSLWYIESGTGNWQGLYVGNDYSPSAAGSDFDGDGRTDPAKYAEAAGSLWYLASSTGEWVGTFIGFDAAPYLAGSDYDGDGKTDIAKYVPSAGSIWYLASSTGTWDGIFIGFDGTPVTASDFDGDGTTDAAKYSVNSNSLWYRASSSGQWHGQYLGPEGFTYIEGGDFDGDGRTDPAKFVPSAGSVWYLMSSTGAWQGMWLGQGAFEVVN